MNWSKLWPWRWVHAKKAPTRRTPSTARLAVETLEDRVVPSTTTTYEAWRQETYHVDDATVATTPIVATQASSVPQNASFGSMIGLPSVFTNTPYRGAGYSVAIIDTGIDYNNPALGGGFGPGHRVIAGWDFVNNDANPMDDNGHGTHVAGIIGSSDATYSGIAPNVNLIALKVLGADGSGTFGNVQNALDWVIANQAKYHIVAINMSLGAGNYATNPYTFLDSEFSTLKNDGVFMSVAAGNSFYSNNSAVGLDYPAVDPYVVSVGAVYDGNFGQVAWASGARDYTTGVDHIASFSQRGPGLSIMAPGAMITSTYLHNTFQAMAGTSMASPVVAGAAVILHQELDALHKTANEDTILSIMKSTGVKVVDGDDENDNVTNTGLTFKRLNLGAAVASLGTPANGAPVLQPIANTQIAPGSSAQITLSASDPNGDAITFAASVLSGSQSQAFQLKQQLGLTYLGSYYLNAFGQNEKWMGSTAGTWYCVLPNGQVRRWTGSMATTLQAANLIATLDTSFYADPSLLWNAQASTGVAPTVSIAGNQLTVSAPANANGSYQIQVTASDGKVLSTQTFTVIVHLNSAPQIAAIASQSLLSDRSQTIALSATDAQNDSITFTAKLVGSFTTPPASLVLVGNQLTIYTSPDFTGSYDVQVSASDGSLSSSTTMHVTVAASPVAFRLAGDFNGDGVQDVGFFNQDGSFWVSLNQSGGGFVNQKWSQWASAAAWSQILVGDVNGDHKADLIGLSVAGNVWIGRSTGSSMTMIFGAQWAPPTQWKLFQIADVNGDGKADIVGFAASGSICVGVFNGASFTTRRLARWAPASNWTSLTIADVNGDGRADVLGLNANGKWYVAYSTGSGVITQLWTASTPPTAKAAT